MPRKKSSSAKKPKAQLARNTFVNSVFNVFSSDAYKAYNFRQISAKLGVSDKVGKALVSGILEELCHNNSIVELNRGKYKLNPELIKAVAASNSVTGKVDMKQTGKAYVISEDLPEDVYIAPNNTFHALNGDIVKVHLFPTRKGRKTEGQIIEIIERGRKQFVGVIHVSGNFAFLVPDNSSIPVDIYIPLTALHGAKHGQKVVARISDWPAEATNPIGEVLHVLGEPGNNDVEMNSILAEFDFPLHFPKEVENDAEKIPNIVTAEEISRRRDFRDVWTCTIDPLDAKDFDDALSLKNIGDGLLEIGVHIADVSHYVKPGSPIDREAFERGTSIYLVDRTIPMLPEKLSNLVCSLRPDEEKLCVSAVFEMDEKGKVFNEWFGRTVIKSNRRYAYEEVQVMLEGAEGDFKDELMTLHRISDKLRQERFHTGSIAFHTSEVKFDLDDKGKPIGTYIKEQKEANFLIEDFMLLANRRVAEKTGKVESKTKPKTFVYRIHDEPNAEKLANFSEFLHKLGYKLNLGSRKGVVSSFNKLFEDIAGKGEQNMIESIAIRTMAKAIYSTKNIGHYGLAFRFYTHFTSPIRRYPDLMVHRLMLNYMEGKPSVDQGEFEGYCIHSTDMERKAVEAERASVKYKQAEYLSDKIGKTFPGLISGVSKWGLFVELKESKCEGMVSIRYMKDDFYYLDEENYRVIGQRYGRQYKLGDPVIIRVKAVNLQKKQMDFEIVENL